MRFKPQIPWSGCLLLALLRQQMNHSTSQPPPAAATAFPTNLPLMLSNRQGGLKLGATQKRQMTPKDGRDREKCPGSNRAQKDGRRKKKNERKDARFQERTHGEPTHVV